MKEKKTYIKHLTVAFYTLFFFAAYYFARSSTIFLRGEFRFNPNLIIWFCLLAGSIIYFPEFGKEDLNKVLSNKYDLNNDLFSLENLYFALKEIGRLILFMILSVLAFCTQELERLHMNFLEAGMLVIILCLAAAFLRYRFKGKERALDIRDIIILFLIAGIYYYFGFAINYRNIANPAGYVFHNVVILFIVLLLVLFITANLNITVIIGAIINPIWALIHYFVYQFRGSIFIPNDIRSLGTAVTVADRYEYFINSDIWRMCTFSFVIILLAANYKKVYVMQKRKVFSITGTVVLSLLIIIVYNINFIKLFNLPYAHYKQDEWYDGVGYTLGFIEVMKKNKVKAPDNYNEDTIRELALKYSKDMDGSDAVLPNIIVVMNEAYADLGDLGEIETNIDYMPYYHSLKTTSDTAVGRTLVSVLGGNTCQSEYEFLTGNSIEFAPNTFPYTSEISGDIYSVVTTLKSQGYHAIATHPNVSTNWKRNVVYKYLQFDDLYFIDDYEDSEHIREFVSDKALFDKILTWLDNSQPQFVFAVSMQNHGGYIEDTIREGEPFPVVIKGETAPEGIDEYLSLIYETDKAMEEFIEQLDMLERPTVFVMFGDHFPMMTDEFQEYIMDEGDWQSEFEKSQVQYATPYIVHANYDVDLSNIPEYMSVNYLATDILDACGLDMSPYNNYLLEMQQDIPALNAFGFKTKDNNWYKYSDEYPAEYAEKLTEYNILQYNSIYKNAIADMFAVD